MKIIASPAFKNRESNPYNWLLYSSMQAEVKEFSYRLRPSRGCDILHFHWPEKELNSRKNVALTYARLRWKLFNIDRWRREGTRIVWTVHNLKTHEQLYPRLERWFWRQFISRLDGVIALSNTGLEAALRCHPELSAVPCFVIPHGHYRGEYPDDPALDARRRLGIEPHQRLLLFFGKIRPYKNVPFLISEFERVQRKDVQLYVVGKPSGTRTEEELRGKASSDSRVHLKLKHVARQDVQLYFRAADLVVLPFREILNSGTALLALSFNRPVLVPQLGAMGELAQGVGVDWVRTYTGDLTADTLLEAVEWATNTARVAEAPLLRFDWPEIAARTVEAYQTITAGSPANRAAIIRDPCLEERLPS